MTYSNRSDVFCDWLNVTCSTDDTFIKSLALFMASNMFPVAFSDPVKCKTAYKVGSGILVLECRKRFHSARKPCLSAVLAL